MVCSLSAEKIIDSLADYSMTLDEKLNLYEAVINGLRNQQSLSEITEQLPVNQQLEIFRFMEFLGKVDYSSADTCSS